MLSGSYKPTIDHDDDNKQLNKIVDEELNEG